MKLKENEPDIVDDAMKSVDQAITKARDIGWNQAIDAALSEIERYNTGKELSPLVTTLIANVKKLKK